MKMKIAVSWASLIFQKRFPDVVLTYGWPYIASTARTRSHIATTKQKKMTTEIILRCTLCKKRVCFCFLYNTKIQNFKPLTKLCSCSAWFVLDLIRNPEDRFSCDVAHMSHAIQNAFMCRSAASMRKQISIFVSDSIKSLLLRNQKKHSFLGKELI